MTSLGGWSEGGAAGSYGEYMKSRAEGPLASRSQLERLIAEAAAGSGVAHSEEISPVSTFAPRSIALIGDAFVDFVLSGVGRLPTWGTDVPCSGVRMLPGGSCANTARQISALGSGGRLAVSFLSCVGSDEPGRFFVKALADEGGLVEVAQTLQPCAGVAQSCCAILAGPSDRAMISCYASNERITIGPFKARLLGPGEEGGDGGEQRGSTTTSRWDLFHIGGYFNCVGLHTDDFVQVVRTLRARGTRISLIPQHDAREQWTGEGGHLSRLLPHVDIFMPNEVEIVHVVQALQQQQREQVRGDGSSSGGSSSGGGSGAGSSGGGVGESAPSSCESPEAALEDLAGLHPSLLIVLTLGAAGLRAARGPTERWAVPAFSVPFVDATGAGDACAAGFLAQYLDDPGDVQTALRHGAAAGGLCVQSPGACETPITRDALSQLLDTGRELPQAP